MIVVGAGASTDSIWIISEINEAYRPPVTDEVFTKPLFLAEFMSKRYGAASLAPIVIGRVAREKSTLEEALTKEYQQAQSNPTLRRGFVDLRLYLRDLFAACTKEWPLQAGNATNYAWLVHEVEEWRERADGYVLWVTFNYDGLLDDALQRVYRMEFGRRLESFIADPDWALLKLHGSYDWVRQTGWTASQASMTPNHPSRVLARVDNRHVYYDADRMLETEWRPEDQPLGAETGWLRKEGTAWTVSQRTATLWAPALVPPLGDKAAFEAPTEHVAHLDAKLPDVDLSFTIGWRAQEQHFLEKLNAMSANPPDVLALSKDPAKATGYAQVVAAAAGTRDGFVPSTLRVDGLQYDGFSDLVKSRNQSFAAELDDRMAIARRTRAARMK